MANVEKVPKGTPVVWVDDKEGLITGYYTLIIDDANDHTNAEIDKRVLWVKDKVDDPDSNEGHFVYAKVQ